MTNNQKNHIGNALIFMCRYSYHRQTSADMACNSALKALWEFVHESHRKHIIEEIENEIDHIESDWLWKDFLEWENTE